MEAEALHTERLARATGSLAGLAVGDALGGFFEFAGRNARRRIAECWLPSAPWHWTDDTQMAGAVVATLRRTGGIDQDLLAVELAARYERSRGYGMATRAILSRLRRGADWRVEAPGLFGGAGSFGNGAASRVPPVGAYFADDLEATVAHAARSAVVTHAHPEAVAGAVAVALAAALTWHHRDRPLDRIQLLDQVIAQTPPSLVRDGLIVARDLPPEATAEEAAARLGSGTQVSCQDTVPFALWCAAAPSASFEAAIWLTLSGLGDCDTTAAIVGGIVVLRTGSDDIPPAWRAACEPLPNVHIT
jgi:ADP-ribosylglycohydrolase